MIFPFLQINASLFCKLASIPFAIFLTFALALLAGCATGSARPSYFPIAQQEASVRWEQANRDRLIADVVFSHDGADGAALVIGKHQTYLELFRQGEALRASGRMARPPWRGNADSAPYPLSDWAMLLEAWQAARNLPGTGRQEIHTKRFRVSFERSGTFIQNMVVAPSGSGSTFVVRFRN